MPRLVTVLLFLLVLQGCTSSPTMTGNFSSDGSKAPASTGAIDANVRQQAETFDKYVSGKLIPEEWIPLRDGCQKKPDSNLFCYSYVHSDTLDKKIKNKVRVYKPIFNKPAIPLNPKFSGNKVINWRELRNAKMKPLLAGLAPLQYAQLEVLAKLALKDKRCPNAVAVGVGASLEDFLPDQANPDEIAKLYDKGAACAKRVPVDRENYLTRAGLLAFFKKNYKDAAVYLARSAAIPNAFSGRALYWLFRARTQLQDTEGAKTALNDLLSRYPFTFHALIAATATNRDPGEIFLKNQNFAATRSQRVSSANILIQQAEILKQCDFDGSAAILADWALDERRLEPEVKIYIAQLAEPKLKITTINDILTRNPNYISRQTMELFFPRGFASIFDKNPAGMDPYLLMSVARQESTFNPKAISPANAQGLMQIHPDTGKKLAGRDVDLLDPKINIDLGAQYLLELIEQMNGQVYMALAAYNAGTDKLRSWIRRYPTNEGLLFVDLISYRETRGYVSSVLRNYYWYRRIHQNGDNKDLFKKLLSPEAIPSNAPAISSK